MTSASPAVKPTRLRFHLLIAAARDLGVARLDLDLVRAGRFRAARDDQQGRQAVPEVGRSERNQNRGNRHHRTERHPLAAQLRPLDRHAVLDGAAAVDGLLDQALDEARRRSGFDRVVERARRLDGAEDGGLQRRIAFLEIQGDLSVGHAALQRAEQADVGQQPQRWRTL